MKTKIILTFTLIGCLVFSSQAQYKKADLVGPWQLSMEAMFENMSDKERSEMDAKKEMMAIMFGMLRIDFMEDGTTKIGGMMAAMAGKGNEPKGKWRIEGDRLITIDDKGKEKSEKILELTKNKLVVESKKKKGEKVIFISLTPIIKDMEKTNKAKISKKKVAGTWKAIALRKKSGNEIMALGIQYVFNKDGSTQLKTILGHPIKEKQGTWKVVSKNEMQFTSKKKDKTKITNVTVLYFTNTQMIAEDAKGERILFERIK